MSNAIFPALIGQSWNVSKRPEFNTKVHRAVSGYEARASFMAYPLWNFSLSYEVLRDANFGNDYKQLVGFFLARRGQFDSFLYTDPNDNSVTDQQFGVGDGVTKDFQLVRAIGYSSTFVEPVQNPNVITNIKDNGAAAGSYTVSDGLISFAVAPVAGHALTWTGTFYYRCRFLQDDADFNQMMQALWELKKLEFVGSTMNKVGV